MTILQELEHQIVTQSRAGALACAAAAAAAVLVYLNALQSPFVYDDFHTVVGNTSLARLTDVRAIVLHDVTRPIVNLSYAVDRQLWGGTGFGYHATNIVLHAIDVALLFAFARRLELGVAGAFGAALLFAVHPMMTEAVGYISGRSEILCGLFFLTAMMAGRRWLHADAGAISGATAAPRRGRLMWPAVTVALWLCALASKEIGAMFPLVLLTYDELVEQPDRASRRRHWMRVHGPLIGFAALAALARVAILTRIESPGRALIHWPYALVAVDVIRRYVVLMVNPREQTIFHAIPPIDSLLTLAASIAIGSVAALVFVAWSLRRTAGAAAFGIVWFLLLLVPGVALTTLNVGEPMAEHRVYLASCGLFLAAGTGVARLRKWSDAEEPWARPVVPVMLAVVAIAFGAQTIVRNRVWQNPIALWSESVDLAPAHYRPHLLLGEALQEAGRRSEALDEYKAAIQLRPKDSTGYNKLGALYAAMGRVDEARQTFRGALDLDPRNETALRALMIIDRAEPRHGRNDARR